MIFLVWITMILDEAFRPITKKFGESVALLAGDSLITIAVEAFLEVKLEPSLVTQGLKRLMRAIGPSGVMGGQALETHLNTNSGLADLLQVHDLKTSALFEAAVLIPMDFASIEASSPQGKTPSETRVLLRKTFSNGR